MTSPQERIRKFLDNKIASLAAANTSTNTGITNNSRQKLYEKDKILSLMGLHKVLEHTQDTDTDDTQDTIDSAFDDSFREISNIYTQIRLSQFSANGATTLPGEVNFNFNDMNRDFINKLLNS